MPSTKSKALVLIVLCMAFAAVWFALPSKKPLSGPDARETTHTLESLGHTPNAEYISEGSEEFQRPKTIARKYAGSPHDENAKRGAVDKRLAAAYRTLEGVHGGQWLETAFKVAAYGEPDEATEAIMDLIQNRRDVTAANTKRIEDWSEPSIAQLQSGTYLTRLRVLAAVGLTGTKRAEEFLLNAYENPHDLVPYKKYLQLADKQRALGYDTYTDYTFLDAITWRNAITGLLLLDEAKYSPMLEEDYYKLVPEAERIYRKENPRGTVEDFILLRRWGTLLDVLAIRDVIRDRGTENPVYLLDFDELQAATGTYSSRYWNRRTKTAVAPHR